MGQECPLHRTELLIAGDVSVEGGGSFLPSVSVVDTFHPGLLPSQQACALCGFCLHLAGLGDIHTALYSSALPCFCPGVCSVFPRLISRGRAAWAGCELWEET